MDLLEWFLYEPLDDIFSFLFERAAITTYGVLAMILNIFSSAKLARSHKSIKKKM